MTLQEIQAAIDKIGCLTITTLDKGTMHSRIVHMMGQDDDGFYFLTMDVKPFYRQLVACEQVSLCGIYPASRATGKNDVGQPAFEPGFTFRMTGEVREVDEDTIIAKAKAGVSLFEYFLEDAERYPASRLFCIHKGKGEVYDFDFEMVNRDHKLQRERFAFGGETCKEAGARISVYCIACGVCKDTCTFNAIIKGDPYRVDSSRCDECGSCIKACPQKAIMLPNIL